MKGSIAFVRIHVFFVLGEEGLAAAGAVSVTAKDTFCAAVGTVPVAFNDSSHSILPSALCGSAGPVPAGRGNRPSDVQTCPSYCTIKGFFSSMKNKKCKGKAAKKKNRPKEGKSADPPGQRDLRGGNRPRDADEWNL